jgi:predicted aldo/keto reductase-like oxidoreductase
MARSAESARAELEESLRALKTDYFDNYQLHALDDPDEIEQVFAPGGAMETLLWAKKQGYIRNIGFTCHTDRAARQLMSQGEFSTLLFPVNYAYRQNQQAAWRLFSWQKNRDWGLLESRQWLAGNGETVKNEPIQNAGTVPFMMTGNWPNWR